MMRVTVEASPEFRAMVMEAVETSRLNNATRHLLSRLIEEWARDQLLRNESIDLAHVHSCVFGPRVIVLDVPIPRGGEDGSATAEEDGQKAKQ